MSQRPLLLGHRGARGVRSIPENTFASFDRALADGCDGFEFDVRLTADGQAVVCHDPKVGPLEVARATADQLADLPRFDQVLKRYETTAFLDIELKVPGLERTTGNLLRAHRPRRGFVVSSFLPAAFGFLREHDPSIPLGLICETKSQLQQWRKLPLEYVVPHHKLVSEDLVRELREANKKIFVWTVNDPSEIRRFATYGVDGIISDNPKLLAESLAECT